MKRTGVADEAPGGRAKRSVRTDMEEIKTKLRNVQCDLCGSGRYEERRIEYLCSYKGDYLLVPDTPVEVCLNCGMVYYDAEVLKEIERRFFVIQREAEQPDSYIQVPTKAYTPVER